MLLPRGIFKLRPIVSFLGPYVSVKTKDHFNLEATMELVEEKGKLGPYRTKFISKGLPFEPAFWIFRGIPKHLEMDTLSAEMHSYAVVHEKVLGKFRVIYASCVPSTDPFDDTPFFTGNILLVAEAKTIEYSVARRCPCFVASSPVVVSQRIFTIDLSNKSASACSAAMHQAVDVKVSAPFRQQRRPVSLTCRFKSQIL